MGEVYLAEDTELNRTVVMKVLASNFGVNETTERNALGSMANAI